MGKRHGPEEIMGKLREAEIVLAQDVGNPSPSRNHHLSIHQRLL